MISRAGLTPCPACGRHVRAAEIDCPFCGSSLSAKERREGLRTIAAGATSTAIAAALLSFTLIGAACESETVTLDTGTATDARAEQDARAQQDANTAEPDTGSGTDAEEIDYGPALPPYGIPPEDAGVPD